MDASSFISKPKQKIAIIGAGISGLSLAWYLQKRFQDSVLITIFEAKERVGGWIHTIEKSGQLFECGPRSIRAVNEELSALIRDLDLEDQILHASDSASMRYIAQEGKLQPLPYSMMSLFTLPLGRKLIKAGLWELFSRPPILADESVESFFNRQIGKQATKTFVSALTSGIYAADPAELSMAACFPKLWQKAKESGSLLRAKRKKAPRARSFTFREGLSTLPKRLASRLDAEIRLSTPVLKVQEGLAEAEIWTAEGSHSFDALFMAIAPHVVRKIAPAFAGLQIPQSSVVTVSLAYKEVVPLPEGFGFLCPTEEEPELLGIVFDSCLFPEQNRAFQTRLSVMMGGTKAPEMSGLSDEELLQRAFLHCKKYLDLSSLGVEHHIVRAENAISCYPVGHTELICRKGRIQLLGSGFHGVAVGDSVLSAKRVANEF